MDWLELMVAKAARDAVMRLARTLVFEAMADGVTIDTAVCRELGITLKIRDGRVRACVEEECIESSIEEISGEACEWAAQRLGVIAADGSEGSEGDEADDEDAWSTDDE